MSAKRRDSSLDETSTDIAIDEIREFLDADGADVKADPAFKEALREKLWAVVQSKARHTDARESDR